MSRNHENLRVFHDAHALTTAIYQQTRAFPRDEWFGLRAQIRRAAVSIPCNLVEGSARTTTREYSRFLTIALGSGSELQYLLDLSAELGLATGEDWSAIRSKCRSVVRQIQKLVERVDALAGAETARR
jgi:four helix bundle protein